DYLAELEAFRRQLPALLDCRFRLGPLTAFGAREAIVRPLRRWGIAFSQALVARLLDLLSAEGFEPPMLQIVCTEVYRAARNRDPGDVRLLTEDLDEVGGLDGVFGRYLDNVTATITRGKLLVSRMILDALMTQEGTKRAVTADWLAAEGRFLVAPDDIEEMLDALARLGLLRPERRSGVTWYELIHEKLVSYVRSWVGSDQVFSNFQIARDIVGNGSRGGLFRTNPGALLNLGQVDDVVGPFRDYLRLDALESEYLVRSAIYNGSASSAYWAGRHGMAEGVSILLEYLGHADRRYRPGAARAAGSFDDPDGRIHAATLALGADPSVEVRQAAGVSLARLRRARKGRAGAESTAPATPGREAAPFTITAVRATGAGLSRVVAAITGFPAELRSALRRARSAIRRLGPLGALRQLHHDLLGDVPELEMWAAAAEEGDRLEGLRLWQRVRARRLAASRFRARFAESIKAQNRAGALAGVFAGAAWGLVLSVALSASILTLLLLIAIFAFWCALAGGLVGWLAARTDVMGAIQGRVRFSPLRLALRSWFFSIVMLFLGVVVAICLWPRDTPQPEAALILLGPFAAVAGAAALTALLEALSYLARRASGAGRQRPVWLWTLLVAASFPLVGLALGSLVVWEQEERRANVLALVAAGISYLVATVTIPRWYAARRAESLPPNPAPDPRPSRLARVIALSGVVAAVGLFSAYWGSDTLPCFSRFHAVRLTPGKEAVISARLGPGFPDYAFLEIVADRDSVVEIGADVPASVECWMDGQTEIEAGIGPTRYRRNRLDVSPALFPHLFIPAGRHQVGVKTTLREKYTEDFRMTLKPVAILDVTDGDIHTETLPRLVKVRFARSGAANDQNIRWTATLRGKIAKAHREGGSGVAIEPVHVGDSEGMSRNALSGMLRIKAGTPLPSLPGPVIQATAYPGGPVLANVSSVYMIAPEMGSGRWSVGAGYMIRPTVGNGRWSVELEMTTAKSVDPEAVDNSWLIWVLPESQTYEPDSDPDHPLGLGQSTPGLKEAMERVERLAESGKQVEAIRACREAIAAYPTSARFRARLVDLYGELSEPGSAAAAALEAIHLDPENPALLNNAAWYLCMCGRFAEAYPLADRAARLAPIDAGTLDTLGHAAFGTGRYEAAARAWERVKALEPDYFQSSIHPHCYDDPERSARARRLAELDRAFPVNSFAR
ncbi:MAG TPA: hypothetical protein VGH33_04730, partial [Isosphaeraceae bacterium]